MEVASYLERYRHGGKALSKSDYRTWRAVKIERIKQGILLTREANIPKRQVRHVLPYRLFIYTILWGKLIQATS